VQEDALVALGDPEELANLQRGKTFDVPQPDHHPLARGQRFDRLLDPLADLLREQAILRDLVPAPRVRGPVPGPRGMLRLEEALGVNRRLAGVVRG
jgi:hypothetical protein